MAIGERIRFIRNLRGMTQKFLGLQVGFSERTADIRMAQYESGSRTPKADLVEQLADALDVSTEALNVPNIDSYTGLMHTQKSFYKLLMSKFDLKQKEKLDKKERNKKKKENNNRKSDQALIDLYYKVKDEAFHINKNKRNIPMLYSTIQDIYIMSNNNPEELYLQSLRIDEEETFLGKDITRQQKEIDELIDEKRREMKLNLKCYLKL